MTHLVDDSLYPTKKALAAALVAGEDVRFYDPAVVNPRSWTAKELLASGQSLTCTNGYRKWFARVFVKDGKLRVE